MRYAAVAATLRVVIYIDTGYYEGGASEWWVSEYILFMESIEALEWKEGLAHRPCVLSQFQQAINKDKVKQSS